MRILRRMLPRSTFGQTVLIILAAVVFVVVVGRIGEVVRYSKALGIDDIDTFIERVATIASLVREAPEAQRPALVSWGRVSGLDLELVTPADAARMAAASLPQGRFERLIATLFPPDREFPADSRLVFLADETLLLVPIDGTDSLVAHRVPSMVVTNNVFGPLSYYILASVTLLVLFGSYSRWAFLAPLARIAAEVKRSDGLEEDRLVIGQGPSEVVALTDALNQMRARVRALLDTRARMLRGVSHDLRTPLTRLRLRVERVEDAHLQQTMLSDIRQIDALIEETIDYLRADASGEDRERVDLASLLRTIQADFDDLGCDIGYEGPDRLVATIKPNALLRAVTNLCSNGLKFGSRVTIALSRDEATVRIDVADDGPGIPPELRERVLEPFFKGDPTRLDSGCKTGFGLGLSIVSEIVTAHRGSLTLLDNQPCGLIARIILPRD